MKMNNGESKCECINGAIDLIMREAEEGPIRSQVIEVVDIGFGGKGRGHKEFTGDGRRCYAQVLAYLISGKEVYAKNATKIIRDWTQKCKVFKGENAPLEAAWGTAAMARSCELLKYTYAKWDKTLEREYINWVKRLLMPHLKGETEKYKLKWGFYNNWHTSILEAKLQFALLCDETKAVNECVEEFKKIQSKYIQENGFTYETLRDSDHNCFGMAGIINVSEILYNQGIDVYSMRNSILHKTIELHAEIYNGNKIPDGYKKEQFNIYKWIQPSSWEIVYNHYVNRNGKKMPNTKQLLEKIRPCKFELHWGYDTITHYNAG
jgi:hypothetical protein